MQKDGFGKSTLKKNINKSGYLIKNKAVNPYVDDKKNDSLKNGLIYKKYDQYRGYSSFSKIVSGPRSTSTTRWSPVSTAGRIYEWNRGVIGISQDGEVVKENLDGTINHHADATVRITEQLNASILYTYLPFEAGIAAAFNGIVIAQMEGDKCLVYLPSSISNEQRDSLNECLENRASFIFSVALNGAVYEDLSLLNVKRIIDSITLDVPTVNARFTR